MDLHNILSVTLFLLCVNHLNSCSSMANTFGNDQSNSSEMTGCSEHRPLMQGSYSLQATSSQAVYDVDDHGAMGDGTADDSQAFQKAWAKVCASSVPAALLVPSGKKYLVRPIIFSGSCASNVTMMIKGTIEAPSDRSAWNSKNQRHWILFRGVDGLAVTGGGSVNGNGEIWWQNSCKVNSSLPCADAPTAMTFSSCTKLNVQNLKVQNSQQIHLSFEKCADVVAEGLTVTAPSWSPNTDGIHVTGTNSIQIRSCAIGTGDDCISVVSGSSNIVAANIYCGPGHGISIGSLGANNSSAQVSGVTIDGARISGTRNGVRIKTWPGGSGYAKNIVFKNIVMDDVRNPIIIDQNYCDSRTSCIVQNSGVKISNVVYENIKGTSTSKVAINFNCSQSIPCDGIVLQNIYLVAAGGGDTISICKNVEWTGSGTIVPAPCMH